MMLSFSSRNSARRCWRLTSSCLLAFFMSSSPSTALRRSASRQSFLASLSTSQRKTTLSLKSPWPRTISSTTLQQAYYAEDLDDSMMTMGSRLSLHPGAVKYEMTPLPDSLIDTTIFVGNLGDFVTDEMLSTLFAKVSNLQTVPSAVARKPNNYPLGYGFVTFPTAEQAEKAIATFHGCALEGRSIKVERIRPDGPRVRVPEKLLLYTLGEVKRTREGKPNTLRRISKDDVERLSRGQPAKKKGYGSRGVPHRLNEGERAAFERAARKGFVTLEGTGYRRGRKGSPLANIHRQWCDARAKPQIVLCKASGGRMLDNVIVDLSPLRCIDDDFLTRWKADILHAAAVSGMALVSGYKEDSTHTVSIEFDEYDDDEPCDENDEECLAEERYSKEFVLEIDSWSIEPIWRLPMVSVGVFEGDRTHAKAMAKRLSLLWEIRDEAPKGGAGAKNRKSAGAHGGGKTKVKSLSSHRQRGQE